MTNGAKLVLCEPVKNLPDSDAEDDAEEGESEMEEGGEDEIDEEDASNNGDDQEEAAEGEKADDDDEVDERQSKGAPLGFGFQAPQKEEESKIIKNPEMADDDVEAAAGEQ